MFRVGSRFARLSFVGFVATAFLGGATMMPAFAREIVKSRAGFAQACDRFLQVGGEDEKGQIAVATAIRNRLRSSS